VYLLLRDCVSSRNNDCPNTKVSSYTASYPDFETHCTSHALQVPFVSKVIFLIVLLFVSNVIMSPQSHIISCTLNSPPMNWHQVTVWGVLYIFSEASSSVCATRLTWGQRWGHTIRTSTLLAVHRPWRFRFHIMTYSVSVSSLSSFLLSPLLGEMLTIRHLLQARCHFCVVS